MKTFYKACLYFIVALLVIVASVFSLAAYLYYHPERAKSLLTGYVTRALGRVVEVKELRYELRPVTLEIKGLKVFKKKQPKNPEIYVKSLSVRGRQSREKKWDPWHYDYIKLDGLEIHLSHQDLESIFRTSVSPPGLFKKYVFRRFVKRLESKFSVKELSLTNCLGSWKSEGLLARFEGLNIHVGKSGIRAVGPFEFGLRKVEMTLRADSTFEGKATDVRGSGTISFTNGTPVLKGDVSAGNLEASSRLFYLRKGFLKTGFAYCAPLARVDALVLDIPEEAPLTVSGLEHGKFWGRLVASAQIDTANMLVKQSSFKLTMGDMLAFGGSVVSSDDDPAKLFVKIVSSPIPVEELFEIFKKSLPQKVQQLKFLSPWHPVVKLDATVDLIQPSSRIVSKAEFEAPKLRVSCMKRVVECDPKLDVRADFRGGRLSVTGNMAFENGLLEISRKGSVKWNFLLSASVDDSNLNVDHVLLKVNPHRGAVFPQMILKGKLAADLSSSTITDFTVSVTGPQIGKIDANARGSWEEKKSISLVVDWKKHNIGKLLEFFRVTRSPWELIASSRIKLILSRVNQNLIRIRSSFKWDVDSLSDPDYQYGGDKISVLGKVNLDVAPKKIRMAGSVKIPKGELLLNLYYVDFSRNPFKWEMRGQYSRVNGSLKILASNFRIKDIVTVSVPGTIRLDGSGIPYFDLSFKIPDASVSRLFNFFVKEPYKDEIGYLNRVSAGGKIVAAVAVTGSAKDPTFRGKVFLKEASTKIEDKTSVGCSLDGVIPLWIRPFSTIEDGKVREKPLKGSLRISLFSVPFLGDYRFDTRLLTFVNLVKINNHILLKNDALDIDISPVEIHYKPPAGFEIDTGASVRDVKIGKVITSFVSLNRPLNGHLRGNLDRIKIVNGTLITHGYLTAKIFKGTVKIANLGVENVFSQDRILDADIDFRDIDLEELTAITNFGKITGVLEGYIHNLKIAYGQPVSFDALFQTVKKKGITQKINVKAVDNIAQLGGSGSSFQGLGKLVTVFFKEFPYEQIGIRCTLKNDVFTIRGTVISDHTEYLVKRKGLTGINVINRNPNNNISFKDMIRRLRRITQTSKPVIGP